MKTSPNFLVANIITKKDKELYNCINKMNTHYYSNGLPTYWPTDPTKKPDCIDFLLWGISELYIDIKNLDNLTSDHSPLLYSAAAYFVSVQNFSSFQNTLTGINFIETTEEIGNAFHQLTIIKAAKEATPSKKPLPVTVFHSQEVRKLIEAKRAARHR